MYSECRYIPKLTSSPLLLLRKDSLLTIVNNHASGYGGGIAIKGGCRVTDGCFYKNMDILQTGRVIMRGNKAGIQFMVETLRRIVGVGLTFGECLVFPNCTASQRYLHRPIRFASVEVILQKITAVLTTITSVFFQVSRSMFQL